MTTSAFLVKIKRKAHTAQAVCNKKTSPGFIFLTHSVHYELGCLQVMKQFIHFP